MHRVVNFGLSQMVNFRLSFPHRDVILNASRIEEGSVDYFYSMWRVLRLDEGVYPEMGSRGLTLRYAVTNVFVLGVLYGGFSIYFNQEQFRTFSQPLTLFIAQMIVMLTGIAIAFLVHGGMALLVWTFSRGVGGKVKFSPTYLNLGIAAVSMWPAIPGLIALRSGFREPIVLVYASVAGLYALTSFFVATKSASGLSSLKMSAAAALAVIFITCFLYLWVG